MLLADMPNISFILDTIHYPGRPHSMYFCKCVISEYYTLQFVQLALRLCSRVNTL